MNTEMNADMTKNDGELVVNVSGRLDAITSKEFEKKLMPELADVNKLILDFAELDYISSAGLRVLVAAYQNMDTKEPKGEFVIRHLDDSVKTILNMTGLLDVFSIEE